MLFRLILIAGFLPLAGGCSNFGQAKLQRVQMPVENDARSVSLDDQNRDETKVIAKAEPITKKTAETKTKEAEVPKEPKTLKVEDLPPALKLLSLKSEQDAKDKLSASKPQPLSIPPPPEPEKELAKNEKNKSEPKTLQEIEPFLLISEKPIFEKPIEAKGPTLEASKTPVEEKKLPEPKIIPEVLTLSPAVLAFKQILENKPEEASKTLKDGPAPNPEIIEFLLNAAGLVLKNDVLDSKEASQALELVGKAQEKLRKQASLNLENMHFCKDIHGFGSFDPLTSSHGFQQGKGNLPGEKIQLYVEVENVHCSKDNEVYESMLSSNLEIHDSKGKVINMAFPPRIDRSRAQRSDYHLTFQFRVPPKLQPGLYTLWVSVEESAISGQMPRSCKKSIDFRIVSPPSQSEERP
ncbi:MAG: hypothetical protein JHC56_11395 [Gemmataceae bacterium]|nr:hypothetical protein [Gemmataceae bacterium]